MNINSVIRIARTGKNAVKFISRVNRASGYSSSYKHLQLHPQEMLRSTSISNNSFISRSFGSAGYRGYRLSEGSTTVEDDPVSPEIQKIVDSISKLSILEVSQLASHMKKVFDIDDAPVVGYGAPIAGGAPAAAEEEAAPKEEAKVSVNITEYDAKDKIKIIKEVRTVIKDMTLIQSKQFVEALPAEVGKDLKPEEAEELKKKFEAVGAKIEIK